MNFIQINKYFDPLTEQLTFDQRFENNGSFYLFGLTLFFMEKSKY